MADLVGILWQSESGGKISGRITLPKPAPPACSIELFLWKTGGGRGKTKFDVYLELPINTSSWGQLPESDDLHYMGEIMSQFFKPPKPSHRRNKILIWGPSGSGKTTLALQFPACAYIDNHGSAEKYESAYPDHLFARPANPDEAMAAVASLIKDPADRRTLVLDDITIYWGQVQEKWSKLFLARLPKSKGHHAEFYTFQPSDWIHPKRELKSLVMRMIALGMNVIVIARSSKEYAGAGEEFMKVIGETFAGKKNLPYEFDFIFELRHQGDKRIAVTHKQRIAPGAKPLPEQFEFIIDAQGRDSFYDFFKDYSRPEYLTEAPKTIPDPVKEEEPVAPLEEPKAKPDNNGNGAAKTISPVPASAGGNGMITDTQAATIKKLLQAGAFTKESWVSMLQPYGVDSAKKLTSVQADKIIKELEDIPF